MKTKHLPLVTAIASTVCAAAWLVNCVLDVMLPGAGHLVKDALLTLVWMVSAVGWWCRWGQDGCTPTCAELRTKEEET